MQLHRWTKKKKIRLPFASGTHIDRYGSDWGGGGGLRWGGPYFNTKSLRHCRHGQMFSEGERKQVDLKILVFAREIISRVHVYTSVYTRFTERQLFSRKASSPVSPLRATHGFGHVLHNEWYVSRALHFRGEPVENVRRVPTAKQSCHRLLRHSRNTTVKSTFIAGDKTNENIDAYYTQYIYIIYIYI